MSAQIDFLKRCKELGLHNGKLSNWLDEIEALKAENEALKQQVEQGKRDAVPDDIRKDAERYLWLKSQKGLALSSCGGSWIKGNIKFNASHRLCANGTAYAPYETLDEAIDAAIAAAPELGD